MPCVALHSVEQNVTGKNTVLLAILARNNAHVLPYFLSCIENLDYDKKQIIVYIDTNNNEDNTQEILERWMNSNKDAYLEIIFHSHEVRGLASNRPHEWTLEHFKVLGGIREKSLRKTQEYHCDYYFVVDCDNFITPCTLQYLIAKQKPIIAPMLRAIPNPNDPYSNFFYDVTESGYYKAHPDYSSILYRTKVGTFSVPVVHCTYLIQASFIDKLRYLDGTNNYEFVIFSGSARQNKVEQYICNEKDFGVLLHFQDDLTVAEEVKRVENFLLTRGK